MYSGNQASYDNLSENMKQKLEGLKTPIVNDLTTGGSDKALSAESGKELKSLVDEKADSENLKSLQTEVTEHLAEFEQKVDIVNTFNVEKHITNLGKSVAEKTFPVIEWKNNNVSSEVVEILMVPSTESISGIIELNLASTFANSNASGGAKILYHITASNKIIHSQDMTIIDISKNFASNFYVSDIRVSEHWFYIYITKKSASNPLSVNIKFQGAGDGVWDILNKTFLNQPYSVEGFHELPTQESRFAKRDKNSRFTNTFPITLQPIDQVGHVFHKDTMGNFLVVPTNSSTDPNVDWSKASAFRTDGSFYTPKIIVDGVDLKQSVSDGKTNVAQAITDVGWYTSPQATFDEMASNIRRLGTVKEAKGKAEASAGYITVRGIGFRPTAILCKAEGVQDGKLGNAAWVGEHDVGAWSDVKMYVSSWDRNSILSDVETYPDGFRIRVDDTNRNGFFGYYAVGKNI
ncbi:hypothetical protein [Lysinibacillus sp. G4S2]|uniref:hypothetical protein n=1 Tax=Lysinibacillus sp. G4S2 TaxID=3055859 RepID=UPI0025A1729A|nr:hypothetical protein [Lysinibacillus sp. G4S2]MDM5250030.1 hypothetical protein [Lysinibacillus sp. G4S2]